MSKAVGIQIPQLTRYAFDTVLYDLLCTLWLHSTDCAYKLEFWDIAEEKILHQLDLHEPILGLRLTDKYLLILLEDRVVCVENAWSKVQQRIVPGIIRSIYNTGSNPHALACINGDIMVLPGQTPGQAQITSLADKTKRIIPAHNSALKAMALSKDGKLLATAGEQVRRS